MASACAYAIGEINNRNIDQGPEWYNTGDPEQQYSRGDMPDLRYLCSLTTNGRDIQRVFEQRLPLRSEPSPAQQPRY